MAGMGHSAIETAQGQCEAEAKGCRWLSQALGLSGGQGCFWTDLVRCAQDCGQPPHIAADSRTTGDWDCRLEAHHWRLTTLNLIALTLSAWSHLPDDDPGLYAFPAARIIQVRDIWGQSVWQPHSNKDDQVIGFYYDYDAGILEWRRNKPSKHGDDPERPNIWPGLKNEWGSILSDCFVVDLSFTTPDGKALGTASALFNALVW